jgi:hypothetical protein
MSAISAHVLSWTLRRPVRAAASMSRTTSWLQGDDRVSFFLCGRTSAGDGLRDISRSQSLRRLAVIVEWDGSDGRGDLDSFGASIGAEVWSASLTPRSTRGRWNGVEPFQHAGTATDAGGPVASLTCARVRPRHLVDFYVRAFPGLAREARRPGSAMVAGLGFGGAVPLRDACTLTFWPSGADVDAYAFRRSPHDAVQRRAMAQHWMRQSLFARFDVTDHGGTWSGVDPLA